MSLPSGYKRLEYIQSSVGQYIDTGVVPGSDNFSISAKFQAMQDPSGADNWFVTIGHSKPSGSASYAQFGTWKSKWAIHLTGVVVDGVAASTNIVNITFGVNGNVASISGDATHSITNSSFSSGSYRNQSITICDGLWRTYWSQIKVSGSIVRDYIPCQKPDGTVGLWDDVNSVFYGNAGTGTFTAGPVVASPSIFVNIDGIWKPINHIYVNINNIWQKST